MSGVDESSVPPLRDRLRDHWWRLAMAAAALVMAGFAWFDPLVAVFAVVPVLTWCMVTRSVRGGVVVALGLLAVTAWILLPRDLGLSGQWVPSVFDVCLFLPIVTAIVYGVGARAHRLTGCLTAVWPCVYLVIGLAATLLTVVDYAEGYTGDEAVLPGPSGLSVAERDKECGSGGCSRSIEVSGDRAAERMRAHLDARGFALRDGRLCRTHDVVIAYRVCASVKDVSPTTVHVSWSI